MVILKRTLLNIIGAIILPCLYIQYILAVKVEYFIQKCEFSIIFC